MDLTLIIIMAGISAAMIFYSLIPRGEDKRRKTLRRLQNQSGRSAKQSIKLGQPKSKPAKGLLMRAAPALSKAAMPKTEEARSNLRVKLSNAGLRGRQTPSVFLASKTVLGIICAIAALAAAVAMRAQPRNILGAFVFGGAVGLMLPNLWLALAIKSRKEKVAHGMPDSLDLMVVTIEAGLGMDAALKRVSEEMKAVHPELAEELVLTTMETQMGLARSEALTNLATRTDIPEMKSLTAILIQAERFGTSIAQAVRTHADSMRVKRSQQAEERAAKTAVKLIIPLILFIFPALFVVLAGPAMMKLLETLTAVSGGL
ncbi:MAG: type II secretion system F family protein [Actinobacteria bacterium]|nr:type II secretion system F family protein [Actinomycetota bacterium]